LVTVKKLVVTIEVIMKSGTIGDRLEMIMIAMGLKQYQLLKNLALPVTQSSAIFIMKDTLNPNLWSD